MKCDNTLSLRVVSCSQQCEAHQREPVPESNWSGVIDGLCDDWFDLLMLSSEELLGDPTSNQCDRDRAIEWWDSMRWEAISNTSEAISSESGELETDRDLYHAPLTAAEFASRPFLRRSRLADDRLRMGLIDPDSGQRFTIGRTFGATTKERFALLRLLMYAISIDHDDMKVCVWADGLRVV